MKQIIKARNSHYLVLQKQFNFKEHLKSFRGFCLCGEADIKRSDLINQEEWSDNDSHQTLQRFWIFPPDFTLTLFNHK